MRDKRAEVGDTQVERKPIYFVTKARTSKHQKALFM